MSGRGSPDSFVRRIDLAFDYRNIESSIKSLIYCIRPEWCEQNAEIKITQLMGGLTNTVGPCLT